MKTARSFVFYSMTPEGWSKKSIAVDCKRSIVLLTEIVYGNKYTWLMVLKQKQLAARGGLLCSLTLQMVQLKRAFGFLLK